MHFYIKIAVESPIKPLLPHYCGMTDPEDRVIQLATWAAQFIACEVKSGATGSDAGAPAIDTSNCDESNDCCGWSSYSLTNVP